MRRRGFTVTELLVAAGIILVLVSLIGSAASAARNSQKANVTRATIDKLNTVLTAQLAKYDSMSVPIPATLPAGFSTRAEYRSWYIRRNLISGDLPDRWADVRAIASGTVLASGTVASETATLPITTLQKTHVSIWKSGSSRVTDQYGDAECLFMIVMRSGAADCLDCGQLRTSEIGDQDTDSNGNIVGDGMPEFLDAWGKPIGFVLWPVGVQLPPGANTNFFSGNRALQTAFPGAAGPSPSPTLGMRPLIFSAGPDGKYSIDVGTGSNILMGINCGNPTNSDVQKYGSLNLDPTDGRADNITNFDAEAKQ